MPLEVRTDPGKYWKAKNKTVEALESPEKSHVKSCIWVVKFVHVPASRCECCCIDLAYSAPILSGGWGSTRGAHSTPLCILAAFRRLLRNSKGRKGDVMVLESHRESDGCSVWTRASVASVGTRDCFQLVTLSCYVLVTMPQKV